MRRVAGRADLGTQARWRLARVAVRRTLLWRDAGWVVQGRAPTGGRRAGAGLSGMIQRPFSAPAVPFVTAARYAGARARVPSPTASPADRRDPQHRQRADRGRDARHERRRACTVPDRVGRPGRSTDRAARCAQCGQRGRPTGARLGPTWSSRPAGSGRPRRPDPRGDRRRLRRDPVRGSRTRGLAARAVASARPALSRAQPQAGLADPVRGHPGQPERDGARLVRDPGRWPRDRGPARTAARDAADVGGPGAPTAPFDRLRRGRGRPDLPIDRDRRIPGGRPARRATPAGRPTRSSRPMPAAEAVDVRISAIADPPRSAEDLVDEAAAIVLEHLGDVRVGHGRNDLERARSAPGWPSSGGPWPRSRSGPAAACRRCSATRTGSASTR